MTPPTQDPVRAVTRPVHAAGAGVCVLMVSLSAFMFLMPGVRARAESREQFARLAAVSKELEVATGTNRAISAQGDSLDESIRARAITLSPPEDLNRRLAELNRVLLDLGLTPEAIHPRDTVRGGITPVIPIRVEVTGAFETVYGLLGVLDTDFPDLHVEPVTFEYLGPGTVRMRAVLSWLTAPPA